MASIRLAQFSGEIPKLLPRLLPDGGSQYAENVRLDDGGLTPVRKSRLETTISSPANIQTIYKFGSDWLAWDAVVNAVPGPVADDRLYYTGDGVPKMRVGSDVYDLAVPAPTAAPTATPSGVGAGDVITRLYVYTFVTDFGEESEPCPISNEVAWQSGITVTLSGIEAAPTGRAISKQRFYRSQSSTQSGTDLFFLEERTASNANWVDTFTPEQFGEVLPSRDWTPPPDDLEGLIAMPNGMMAAFSGKQLCFCEPFRPHAWPDKYKLTASYDIVALAAYGTTVVAGTMGYPYVASGNSPESMVEEKIEVNLPCINARGMVDLGYSVAYPSNDGLVVVSNGGAQVISSNLFTRPDWQRLSPGTLVAGQFTGRYFASFEYVDLEGEPTQGTIIIDLTGEQPFVMRAQFKADAFHYELATGKLFYLVGTEVYEWDALGQNNEPMTWRSKKIVLPVPVSFGAILVEGGNTDADAAAVEAAERAAIIAYNTAQLALPTMGSEIDGSQINGFAINGDTLMPMPVPRYISVSIYADGQLLRVVTELNKVHRIKGDRKSKFWEIQVNGTDGVEQISMASTVRELNEV
jgi:hypothetical protein